MRCGTYDFGESGLCVRKCLPDTTCQLVTKQACPLIRKKKPLAVLIMVSVPSLLRNSIGVQQNENGFTAASRKLASDYSTVASSIDPSENMDSLTMEL